MFINKNFIDWNSPVLIYFILDIINISTNNNILLQTIFIRILSHLDIFSINIILI